MRHFLLAIVALFLTSQTGCNGASASGSPEATLETMKSAAMKKDWRAMAECYTEPSKDLMLFGLAISIDTSELVADDKQQPAFKEAKAILAKHHVKSLDDRASDGGRIKPAELSADVKDKAACIAELMNWYDKNGSSEQKTMQMSPAEYGTAKLEGVKIEGDQATGTVTSTFNGKEDSQPMSFKKVNGKWYFDLVGNKHKP
ncbi:MAG TPA: hypothetical protein VFE24_17420 [Pirellulales bacterium]|nr:hypothetical protein [Pirellulales bacterium]